MKIKTAVQLALYILAVIGLLVVLLFTTLAAITILENAGVCTNVISTCITSEAAIKAAVENPNYRAFVETYPNSTVEYRGDHRGGNVVLQEGKAQLEIELFVSGNIEGTGAVLYCLDDKGSYTGINYTSWQNLGCSNYDEKFLEKKITNKTCG